MSKSLIFDLNGTLIDDMHYHTKAWYKVITEKIGKGMSWDEVKVQMYGKNKEVLDRIFGEGHFNDKEVDKWAAEKEKLYQEEYKPHIKLLPGLDAFLEKAYQQDIKMAIASAAITDNIDFIIDNLGIRHYFSAIVTADNVRISKPHPETFLKAADFLHVKPQDCIVFEDAPKGVEAAQNAGMECVVILSTHPKEDFKGYDNIICFITDYEDSQFQKKIFS